MICTHPWGEAGRGRGDEEGREREEREGREGGDGERRKEWKKGTYMAHTCSINTAYTSRRSCSPEQGGSQSTQLGHCLATEQSCGWSELEKIVVQLVWTVEWS